MTKQLTDVLKDRQHEFSPVIRFDQANQKLIQLDFTDNNNDLTPSILEDTNLFSAYVNEVLKRADAVYGIGGYAEHRTIYSRSNLFDSNDSNDEPRRLHLGLDVWGAPNTAVYAPLDGIVHSTGNNDQRGDYGATLILTHQLEGISFCTLYGHLSLNSIKGLLPGTHFNKGDVIAEFGIPVENGQWPPHLHFQIIKEIGDWEGDYPGVCKYSEKDEWLKNSPDPDLIARLNRFL